MFQVQYFSDESEDVIAASDHEEYQRPKWTIFTVTDAAVLFGQLSLKISWNYIVKSEKA